MNPIVLDLNQRELYKLFICTYIQDVKIRMHSYMGINTFPGSIAETLNSGLPKATRVHPALRPSSPTVNLY